MKQILLKLSFLVIVLNSSSYAASETERAKQQLARQLQILESIQPLIERPELPRLYTLKVVAKRTLHALDEFGLAHARTFHEFQNLIVAYRYSSAYLNDIETDLTRDRIAKLRELTRTISKERGFDDSPYTQITASTFKQIRQLLLQLNSFSIPAALKKEIEPLTVEIGELVALGLQGDRLKTLITAIPVYKHIQELYPDFNQIGYSDRAFDVVLEIQGLNEFYGEFSQFDQVAIGDLFELLEILISQEPMAQKALTEIGDSGDSGLGLIRKLIEKLEQSQD